MLGKVVFIFTLMAVALQAHGGFILSDNFSGSPGTSLAGNALPVGGVWINQRTDGPRMNGNFLYADGGGVVAENNSAASIYTTIDIPGPLTALTNGFTVATTFRANGYSRMDFDLALAERIDKGHLNNLNQTAGDVVRVTYSLGGGLDQRTNTRVWKDGAQLAVGWAHAATTRVPDAGDEIRVSITAYPAFGIFVGEAYNLTGDYLLSRNGVTVNTPAITNLHYAAMGMLSIEVDDPASPAVITSFYATPATLPVPRTLSLEENLPPTMSAFSFDKMSDGVFTPEFQYILDEVGAVDILHSVRPTVYDAVRATYPEKPIIRQLAWGGTAAIPFETIWPGHCLLKVGTVVNNDCAATTNDTVLFLEDHGRIAGNQNAINNATDAAKHAVLFALDEEGKADWSKAEYVKLISIDTDAGSVTVERGVLGSVPQAYDAGRVALARLMMFWSNQWQLNLSLHSPRGGPFNMTGPEWYAFQMAQRVLAADADGIEFDVARWQWGFPAANRMDCNTDLEADYGWIDGINSFGLGGQIFLKNLRELLGPDYIIQMDGNCALYGQRGFQYVDGVQLESFPQANRFYRFSQAFLHLRLWVDRVESPNPFSYPFTKAPTTLFGNAFDTDGSPVDWRFRIGFAAALLTDMPHPFTSITDIDFDPANPEENDPNLVEDKDFFKWDEYVGGGLNDWKWLGPPVGDPIQTLDQLCSTNLLENAVWQWTMEPGFVADGSISNGVYSVVIDQLPANTMPWEREFYPGTEVPKALWFGTRLEMASGIPVLTPGKEYTLEFEARGNDDWTVDGQVFERVPRSLIFHGIANHGYNNPESVFLSPEWESYRLTIIADEEVPPPLTFGFSEQIGEAEIRNIRLYQGGSERWERAFQNGRIYLNMTLDPWMVQVGHGEVQRIRGEQIPELNNGEVVSGWVTVPAWDALVLRADTFDAWRWAQFGLAVSDDFSTGFGGRDPGDELAGFAVQTGLGEWSKVRTDGQGALGGSTVFTAGGVTEISGAVGGAYVTLEEQSERVSIDVVVTPNDFADGNAADFSIGLVETVDRNIFKNINTGDTLIMRYIPRVPNNGRFQFSIHDEGIAVETSFSNRVGREPDSTDTVLLRLSYDVTDGGVTGTVYNLTQGEVISEGIASVPGLSGMVHAGFGWSGIPDQTTSPSSSPGIVSYMMAGNPHSLLDENLSLPSADPDNDGMTNYQEYLAGTDPLDKGSRFTLTERFSDDELELKWPVIDNRIYSIYWSTNLVEGFDLLEGGIRSPQSSYTLPIPEEVDSGFYKVKVTRP